MFSTITRIGSDHNPLLLDDGSLGIKRQARLFFQTWWFGVAGFEDMLKQKMVGLLAGGGPHRCSIDRWYCIARGLRKFLKGWGANLGKERREFRQGLLQQVAALDATADATGLDEEGWDLRYHLED
jgi:hypothetical protein